MEANKNKKDSIFFGIFPSKEPSPFPAPAPAPAPSPAPAQQAPKPAASEEQVSALNRKIELLERSMAGQIEKKLAEQVPPPAQPGPAPEVILKITEFEERLKNFQEKFLPVAAQMKNSEESKISGRREIEELLKVVRDQQKYSELDRQMHDQLEKAWVRVEEMEKRLLDVCVSAGKKPGEPAAPAVSAADLAAEVLKAVDARLGERLKPLETALKNAAAKAEAASAEIRGADGAKGIPAPVSARLESLYSKTQQLHNESLAGRVESIAAEIKKDVLAAVGKAFAEYNSVSLRQADVTEIAWRERIDALSKTLIDRVSALPASQGAEREKFDELAGIVKRDSEIARAAVAAAGKTAAEVNLRLERIAGYFTVSSSSLAAMSAAASCVSEVESRLSGVISGLTKLVCSLENVNLEVIRGVSGSILRENLYSAAGLISELQKEVLLLKKRRLEIESGIGHLSSGIDRKEG